MFARYHRALLASTNTVQATFACQVRLFSTKEKGEAEWGIKYNDECLKFEKEWKQIADKIQAE